jgi:hypothetical protein
MSPTFLAGIAIVVVAIMAYGTTQTHLLFSGLGPACATASCSTAAPHAAGGTPLQISDRPDASSRRPARDSGTSRGSQAGAQGNAAPQPDPEAIVPPSLGAAPAPLGTRPSRLPVGIAYHTIRSWHGEFLASITIANRSRWVIRDWRLWLRYPSGRIDRMWGARWLPAHAQRGAAGLAVARPGEVLRPGARVTITFWAHGRASAPSGCTFSGDRCQY